MQHTVHSTVDGWNPAPVTAHSCSRETLSPPRPPNQCCFRGAFRWCRIMSIQLLFLQQRCNPSMLNGGREGCSHPGLRAVHDSFHPPSGETVFSASDGCFFFWSTRGRFVGLWMCKHKLEPIPFCICQNLNPNALSSSKLLPTRQRRNRFVLFGLWMCKRKLEQIPFCTCQNPNPNTLSSSQLLPTNKEATLQHLLPMWAKIGDQTLCVLHGALFLNVPPRLQKQNCTFLLMKI